MSSELTSRQKEVLTFIREVSEGQGRMPSYREIAKALKLSAVGSVQDHIRRLLERGFLEKKDSKIFLKKKKQDSSFSIPVLGNVAAGALTESLEDAQGFLSFSRQTWKHSLNEGDFFALKVQGLSMVEAGILEDDYVVVYRKARIKSGDKVVVRYRGEATLKEIRYSKSKDSCIELIPWNASMKPIKIKEHEELEVLGRVIALQRMF